MGTVSCLDPHTDLPEVDYLGEGRAVVYCFRCDTEFVTEDGELVPVASTVLVAEAMADEDRLGWDSQRERALSGDPRWGGGSSMDPAEHRWLGTWLRAGIWRGGCTCGERFESSSQTGPFQAFNAHRDEAEGEEQ